MCCGVCSRSLEDRPTQLHTAQLIKIFDINLGLQIKLHKALFDERRLKVVQNMECEPGALEINPYECTVQLYLANILWRR